MGTDYTQRVLELLAKLTAEQRSDVLEILEEVAEEHVPAANGPPRLQVIRETRGALRHVRFTSDDLAKQKDDEKRLEERKWAPR